jgi:hypothetical protein
MYSVLRTPSDVYCNNIGKYRGKSRGILVNETDYRGLIRQFLRLCAGIWLHSDMAHEFSAGRFLGCFIAPVERTECRSQISR